MNRLIGILRGERRGPSAAVIRAIARAAEPIYACAVARRNRAYDSGRKPAHRAHCPVISIGNLTTGGTGKTPMAIFITRALRDMGAHPAIVLRGYKSDARGSDEQRELAEALPEVPIVVNPDRVAAAESIRRDRPRVNAIVLDDGFQHRRIARDLDLVLMDATNPFGYGHLLPRGLMREPPGSLRRADGVIVTRADLVSPEALAELDAKIAGHHGRPPLAHAVHRWQCLVDQDNQPVDVVGAPALACCGIGNPDAFFNQAGKYAELVDRQAFDDHFHYDAAALERLVDRARRSKAAALLTTGKDWVKIAPLLESNPIDLPVWRAVLGIELLAGADPLRSALRNALGQEERE